MLIYLYVKNNGELEISYFLNKMNLTISICKLPSPYNVVLQLSEKYLKMATDKQELQTTL